MSTKTYAADDYAEIARAMLRLASAPPRYRCDTCLDIGVMVQLRASGNHEHFVCPDCADSPDTMYRKWLRANQ